MAKNRKSFLKYWRNCLVDAKRAQFNPADAIHMRLTGVAPETGHFHDPKLNTFFEEAEKAFNEARGVEDPNSNLWISVEEVPVRIAPFCLNPIAEHGAESTQQNPVYPLWIPATLYSDGRLSLNNELFPIIPRRVIAPEAFDRQQIAIATLEEVDEAIAKFHPHTESWESYWTQSLHFFEMATGIHPEKFTVSGYQRIEEVVVCVAWQRAAVDAIIRLYDRLQDDGQKMPLLENLCKWDTEKEKPALPLYHFGSETQFHRGQMHSKFALSPSQRQVLTHTATLQEGDLLAINGPPGTGKTTVIQSLVASLVVKHALNDGHPPVIVATSTNNQAVTNIMESFRSVTGEGGVLYERWVPKIRNFALYLPASSRKMRGDLQYLKRFGVGLGEEIENTEFLKAAEGYWLNKLEKYAERDFEDVRSGKEWLRAQLKEEQDLLDACLPRWEKVKNFPERIKEYLDTGKKSIKSEPVENWFEEGEIDVERVAAHWEVWMELLEEIRKDEEGKGSVPKAWLEKAPVALYGKRRKNRSSFRHFVETQLRLLSNILKDLEAWEKWKVEANCEQNPPDLEAELDMGIRKRSFWLAVHYWEARWLLELGKALKTGLIGRRGVGSMKVNWRRFAMLTPCFVSTLFSLPRFFSGSKVVDGEWADIPLVNYIDLLLVDEAGQVSTDIGAAAFGLAKRAIIIGDTHQIEPIWMLLPTIDRENMARVKLVKEPLDPEVQELHARGFATSSGSLLQLAQHRCAFLPEGQVERGITLLEHRRCYDELISYCNDLAYRNQLQPLRGPAPEDALFPPFIFYPVHARSEQVGSSRRNKHEVQALLAWLMRNQPEIQNYYFEKTGRFRAIEDLVGIITPFVEQRKLLQKVLRKAGYNVVRMKLGTVHALQGAERPIVLFSPCYGHNDLSKNFFFDQKVNMLNVAVSRAQDTFVVVGSEEVFLRDPKSPSGKLGGVMLGG